MLWIGWRVVIYWDEIQTQKEEEKKKQQAALMVSPEQLSGLPQSLEAGLHTAQQQGVASFRNWLKVFGPLVQDPRKAWIELDFCVMVARDNPPEARRIFSEVKARTQPSSPVWPRIQQLAKTYE